MAHYGRPSYRVAMSWAATRIKHGRRPTFQPAVDQIDPKISYEPIKIDESPQKNHVVPLKSHTIVFNKI
jgi:hypothetical protein